MRNGEAVKDQFIRSRNGPANCEIFSLTMNKIIKKSREKTREKLLTGLVVNSIKINILICDVTCQASTLNITNKTKLAEVYSKYSRKVKS